MNELETRLADCFSAAFPDVDAEKLPFLIASDYEQWDSLATVTLAGLVEEEFDIDVGPEEANNFVSFAAIVDFLTKPEH